MISGIALAWGLPVGWLCVDSDGDQSVLAIMFIGLVWFVVPLTHKLSPSLD